MLCGLRTASAICTRTRRKHPNTKGKASPFLITHSITVRRTEELPHTLRTLLVCAFLKHTDRPSLILPLRAGGRARYIYNPGLILPPALSSALCAASSCNCATKGLVKASAVQSLILCTSKCSIYSETRLLNPILLYGPFAIFLRRCRAIRWV